MSIIGARGGVVACAQTTNAMSLPQGAMAELKTLRTAQI
jgi:hypothetical protein